MIRFVTKLAVVLVLVSAAATATTFRFDTDPFEGSTAPGTPGRQIEGGEQFITFDIASDVFSFDPVVFGLSGPLMFLKSLAADVPASGVNAIVLQDTPTPFAAGIAANLIAAQITDPGPGFFIYFNSGLDLPRLVFSPDLSDNTADLKVLARMTNLGGQPGRDALPTFSDANFVLAAVPEPSTWVLTLGGLFAACGLARFRRQK